MVETETLKTGRQDATNAHLLWMFMTAVSGVSDEFERARLTATGLSSLLPCSLSGVAFLHEEATPWGLIVQNGHQVDSGQTEQLLADLKPLFDEALLKPTLLIATADGETDDSRIPQSIEGLKVQSLALVPLRTVGRCLGMVFAGRDNPESFSQEEGLILSTLAEHFAIGFDNLRLYKQLEHYSQNLEDIAEERTRKLQSYAKRLETLHEIDRAILQARSSAAIGQGAVQHLGQLIPCRRATVTVFDFEAGESVVQAIHAMGDTRLGIGGRLSLDAFGSLDTLRQGKVHNVADASTLPSTPAYDFLKAEGLCSWINVPLLTQGELVGTLNVGSELINAFSSEDVDVVREVADSLAIAIQQAQLHDQVQRQTTELEERVAERTAELEAFSYSVSHDLRAPLRAIGGFSRVLLEDHAQKLDPECTRLLGIICSNAKNMGQLIDDLLAFSRLGRQEMRLVNIDMGELTHNVFKELQLSDPNQKVEIHIATLPFAHGDRAMVGQVFANLLSNSIKFTQPRRRPCIEVGAGAEDNMSVYYVKDNGVGFDMRYAEKMFGVFQRLHAPQEFEGTGVGLAIVESIIQRHGGRVWAEGKLGEGATIYFTLPSGATTE